MKSHLRGCRDQERQRRRYVLWKNNAAEDLQPNREWFSVFWKFEYNDGQNRRVLPGETEADIGDEYERFEHDFRNFTPSDLDKMFERYGQA